MTTLLLTLLLTTSAPQAPDAPVVAQFDRHEVTLEAAGEYANPYVELTADAQLTLPDGTTRTLPLFWDGGRRWILRVAPHATGTWRWRVTSRDAGLNGRAGAFSVRTGARKGSLRPMRDHPAHFERQDGTNVWFLGDTAWALFTDNAGERHDRAAAFRYIDARASQGFNVLHSMLLSEAGWGNRGGPPFNDLSAERLNPAYWQEVDARVAHANARGIVCGLALAWGDKRREEPFAWRRFPTLDARTRYARYIAARYGAYDVYFLVSGEWHGEVRTRPAPEADVRREFVEIGRALDAADAHDRMIGIHPMTEHGSVREFNDAPWMAFGDYQQNYRSLHARALESRRLGKPVVNSEYGYFLRDQNGDGVPDKDNSTSLAAMRHATWDIVMAGSYVVTGFGTTYFGGHRDPGPFDVAAARNRPWEAQIGIVKGLFETLDWWRLEPHDALVRSATPRGEDGRELERLTPPSTTYWALAEPGRQYVLYVRGLQAPVTLTTKGGAHLRARQLDPRTGEETDLTAPTPGQPYTYTPPDRQDWVVILRAAGAPASPRARP